MNRLILKVIRKKRFYAFLLLPITIVYLHWNYNWRHDDATLQSILQENTFQYQPTIHYTQQGSRQIRHVEIGADSLPLIVFIHGAPSSSSFWINFLKDSLLLSKAKLMAVDRPGYGYSNLGRQLISVKEQARMIAEVIRTKKSVHRSIILHGSSYGGTVAARIAMDYPDLVDGLLLQSASLAPGEEKIYAISYPTHHWTFRWLVPPAIRMANYEKLSHRIQLQQMEQHWDQINSGVIIFHGDQDALIYPENAFYAAQKLINAKCLELKLFAGRKHDLLWNKPNDLKQALVRLVTFSLTSNTSSLPNAL